MDLIFKRSLIPKPSITSLGNFSIKGGYPDNATCDDRFEIDLLSGETYLIFVIFLHRQNFWRIKFTPKKRVNYDKIHSKLPNLCVIMAKYTVNCQFFALNM